MNDELFNQRLAEAGEILEKLASEQGFSVSDFTEDETADLLATIMGHDQGVEAPADEKVASDGDNSPPAPPPAADNTTDAPQLTYGEVFSEVAKVASANGIDIAELSPEELQDAVEKMASILSDPEYAVKQAEAKEKIAEAEAIGRIMAHSFSEEIAKIAAAKQAEEEESPADKKEDKKEGKKEDKDEESEKKAAFTDNLKKLAFDNAVESHARSLLIADGIDPDTGTKLASAASVHVAALELLKAKGYFG